MIEFTQPHSIIENMDDSPSFPKLGQFKQSLNNSILWLHQISQHVAVNQKPIEFSLALMRCNFESAELLYIQIYFLC